MCRFLVVKSSEPFDPGPWLERFSNMAEESRAPDSGTRRRWMGRLMDKWKCQVE